MSSENSELLAFSAIKELVEGLKDLYENAKPTDPLLLYHRLLQYIKEDEPSTGITKCVSGFRSFFDTYSKYLSNSSDMMKNIPRGTNIQYSDNVYLEIQKYLYQSKPDNREVIRQHLFTISTILDPNEKNLAVLENNNTDLMSKLNLGDSPEGDFISDIMKKAQGAMQDVDKDDPTSAIMGLLSSGIVQDMITGLQTSAENGTMDLGKLMGSMQSAISEMMPSDEMKSMQETVSNVIKNNPVIPHAPSETTEDILEVD